MANAAAVLPIMMMADDGENANGGRIGVIGCQRLRQIARDRVGVPR
jgi:hypothetical protein